MKQIKILGTGCPKCMKLYDNTRQAADELKLDCQIEKVTEIASIMGYGVMTTPALVVDGKVLVAGRVPDTSALKIMLA